MKKTILLFMVFCAFILPWQGNAQIPGSTCGNPLLVYATPFNDSGNTGTYGNNYSSSDVPPVAPGAVTNGTGSSSYLGNGNDVVYSYIAGSNGSIDINTTHTGGSSWNALWVFTGCPFSSTVGYHTGTTGTMRSIPNLPVTAGETYYIVISNWDAGAVDYTISITGPPPPSCLPPNGLGVSSVTPTSVDLEWNDNASATQWDIEWGAEGFTPTGTPTISSTTTNPYPLSGLSPLTQYDFYVRADCGSGDQSFWSGPYTFSTVADCTIYTLSVTANDGYVCDEGSGTLTATASGGGDDIYWYDAAVGGNLLGAGAVFETPDITQTTSFWAAEVVNGGPLAGQANANPTTFSNSTSNSGGLLFTVNNPIVIVDVEVFGTSTTGGDITIELRDIDNGNATIASTTATITGGGTAASPIPHTIPLDFVVPAAGNYRLVRTAATAS
ncbi:MAG: fibronectin type III domain-containing protein, partial [Bacteroidetes bacterium]|nr:fibronectin type III domain-containing protein [Bacteroidota bacterium]